MSSSRANGSPSLNPPSKLPRFLQKQGSRKAEAATAAAGSAASGSAPESGQKPRRGSKFLATNKDRTAPDDSPVDEPPIIVEPPPPTHQQHPVPPTPVPIPSPRARTRSERPAASAPETQHMPNLYASTSSTGGTRIGDLPTRLSGWFAHTFSTSSTDLSLPTILAQHSPGRGAPPSSYDPASSTSSSPRKMAAPAALLAVAKHGSGTLNKAMRYLLDSDAVPDRCADPIWLLGVCHPGWEGPPAEAIPQSSTQQRKEPRIKARRGSWRSSSSSAASSSADGHSSPPSSTGYGSSALSTPASPARRAPPDPGAAWPPAFYADFTSRVWLTYRSHLPSPIRDARLADLPPCSPPFALREDGMGYGVSDAAGAGGESRSPTVGRKVWPWAQERTWSADTGWGCMLRTGQSLLASALVGVRLGRDWRRPPHPVPTPEYAAYVQILTWFLDTPAPHAPFSVHRMALAGKELGTDVGQWFGPSVAAGAIKTLVNAFPECGLSVALATDGTLYQSQIFAASHGDASRAPRRQHTLTWGERPVLILLGIRLGIEGVNPIYYDTIKMLYTFPQSVGIAGGRPSSSYYFVGSQADSLFYLDPHNPRPAVPLRPPPRERYDPSPPAQTRRRTDDDDERRSSPEFESSDYTGNARRRRHEQHPQHQHQHHERSHPPPPTSPSSVRTGASSNFSYRAPASPSPLQQQVSTGSSASASASLGSERASEGSADAWGYADAESGASVGGGGWGDEDIAGVRVPPPAYAQRGAHRLAQTTARAQHAYTHAGRTPSEVEHAALGQGHVQAEEEGARLDAVQLHYCNAYSAAELRTFHCERVRKMPLSGLDPSMLIGFLCRDERDWWDFRRRVAELPKTIFSIQDEPPTWPADMDDDMGLESISEPDELDLDGEAVEIDADADADGDGDGSGDGSERFFDTRSGSPSASSKSDKGAAPRRSSDTSEEDPSDPVTPGPTSRFEIRAPVPRKGKGVAVGGADDDDEVEDEEGEEKMGLGEMEGGADDGGDDIEDDWVDPISSPAQAPPTPAASTHARPPPLTLAPPPAAPPPPAKDRIASVPSSSSSRASQSTSTSTGKPRKTKKQVPVPVPAVRVPPPAAQEHYPFPVTPAEEHPGGGSGVWVEAGGERTRSTSGRKTQTHRMHNARARDGGRTQSGGVRGILTTDT